MLTGRRDIPATFRSSLPQSTDWPSIAAVAGASTTRRQNLPPSVVLPEKIYHSNTGVYPGQFAGLLGSRHEPWMIEATDKPHAYHSYSGAFPEYLFDLPKGAPSDKRDWRFEVPHLSLPEGVLDDRFRRRRDLLGHVDRQQRALADHAAVAKYDRNTQSAITMMTDSKLRAALNVRSSDPKTLERYGDNSFGWSLLMARRLVEAGVHIAPNSYKLPGRDHWAPLQSVLFAGGGVQGGRIIGESDRDGAYPSSDPQKPENFASTIYHALGIPRDAVWHDVTGRPNHVYLADPIEGLFS